MILLIVPLIAVWLIGVASGAPRHQRYIMMAVVFAAWAVLQFVLPEGNAARVSPDNLTRSVVVAAFIAALVYGYRKLFGLVRRRADTAQPNTPATPDRPAKMSGSELSRYSRHLILREIGGQGQNALRDAKVLVVGAGGLGSPALQYLAAAGVGMIGVIDDDVVEAPNLQRQTIHTDAMIDTPKVHSAADAMQAQNPHIEVRSYARKLTADIAADLIAEYDLVLDGCDNFETRYLVNAACVAAGKPLIGAALSQWEGQISVFDPAHDAPCYACIFPAAPAPGLSATCAEAGVLGPLPGVVGSMMAVEAVKVITNAGEALRGRMMIYDALYAETRVISAKRRADCAVCGGAPADAG